MVSRDRRMNGTGGLREGHLQGEAEDTFQGEQREQRPRGVKAAPWLATPPCTPARPRGSGAVGMSPLPTPLLVPRTAGPWECPPVALQVEPPELPEDLRHWIAYNEASSQLLRAESGLSDVVKDQ